MASNTIIINYTWYLIYSYMVHYILLTFHHLPRLWNGTVQLIQQLFSPLTDVPPFGDKGTGLSFQYQAVHIEMNPMHTPETQRNTQCSNSYINWRLLTSVTWWLVAWQISASYFNLMVHPKHQQLPTWLHKMPHTILCVSRKLWAGLHKSQAPGCKSDQNLYHGT